VSYLCADGPLAGQVVELPSWAEGFVLRGGPGEGTVYRLQNEILYWEPSGVLETDGPYEVDPIEQELDWED
jgi:hypothetical protein